MARILYTESKWFTSKKYNKLILIILLGFGECHIYAITKLITVTNRKIILDRYLNTFMRFRNQQWRN